MIFLLKKPLLKRTSGNSLSPLGAQNKDISAASQKLLTGLDDVCNAGLLVCGFLRGGSEFDFQVWPQILVFFKLA